MRRVIVADMVDSVGAWAAVSLAFVVTAATLVISAVMLTTGLAAATWTVEDTATLSLAFDGGLNLVLGSLVGMTVLGTATKLVIESRKPALARYRLAGATPQQVFVAVMAQVVVVATVAAAVGTLLAVPTAAWLVEQSVVSRGGQVPDVVYNPVAMGSAMVLCVAVALLGALIPARKAGLTSAVEAVREATVAPVRRPGWLRYLLVVAIAAVIGQHFVTLPMIISMNPGIMHGDTILMTSLLVLAEAGVLMAVAAPIVLGPLTRLWTAVVPRRFVPVLLARENVVTHALRLVRIAVPTMFAIGLIFGMVTMADSANATFEASGMDLRLDAASAPIMAQMVWVPLAIAVAGAVGSIIMTSKRRDAELALFSIIGATPGQRLWVAAGEALIVTVSASLMGLFMAALGGAVLAWGLGHVVPTAVVSIPWLALGVLFAIGLVVTTMAMVAPTIPAMRLPATRVIARLVAA